MRYSAAGAVVWALLSCMLAGCRDVVEPRAPVDSVKVTGAPAGPVASGTTVQLAATALNASGGALANRPVSWRSSDTTVATVSAAGLVRTSGAGVATIVASVEGKEGAAPLDVRVAVRPGRDGGTFTLFDGAVSLVVPPNTFRDTVTLLIRPADASVTDPRLVPGTAYEIGPEAVVGLGVRLTLRYDPARVPLELREADLRLHRYIGGVWFHDRGSRVAPDLRTVTGSVQQAGTYAVRSPSVSRVALVGPLSVGGALFAGQTAQLTAVLLDANGDTLRGRAVAWSSSDPLRATVDGSGRVTAVSAGEATVRATSENRSAEVSLTTFARPVADWSRASEWTTTQGNARHSGYVAATLDPATFRELWVVDLGNGGALNPVVAGDGKVFVSTAHYSAPDRLLALDARTGATRWSHDFGGVEMVHPPAYGNGRVYAMTWGESAWLWSFDGHDGAQRFRAVYSSSQGFERAAPVVADSGVFAAAGYYGGIYRFDASTGAPSYHVPLPLSSSNWSPAVADGRVYAYDEKGLVALHSRSGAVAFRIADPRLQSSNAPVLDASDNLVAVGQGHLFLLGLQSRQVAWEWPGDFSPGSPTVTDRVVYVNNGGYLEAREKGRGTLLWGWKPPEGGLEGTTVATDNIVFVRSRSVADRRTTYALDARTGKQVWSYPAGGHLALSSQGILFIAQGSGKLAAISVR